MDSRFDGDTYASDSSDNLDTCYDECGGSDDGLEPVALDPGKVGGIPYMQCGRGNGDGSVAEPMDFGHSARGGGRGTKRGSGVVDEGMSDGESDADHEEGCVDDMECESVGTGAGSRRGHGRSSSVAAHSAHKKGCLSQKRELCWLCSFCTHSKARQMSHFISEQISSMSYLHIAEQVKDEILSEYPHARGAQKRDIIRHIQYHVLDPNVRMAAILRSLMSLAESVRLTMMTRDGDTGELCMDVKQADLYLRVVNQVQVAYKAGNGRLLFSVAHGSPAADPSGGAGSTNLPSSA